MAQVKIIAPQTREAEHLRVAAYCRVSSDSKDQLHSYAAQIRSYTEEIAQHDGWELVDVYADEGLTGTRMDQRDDFNRMMRDCRKGKINRILVKSVSRFARNTRDCLSALRELSAMGVSVRFEKENIDTETLTTELMVSVSGSLAQQESISISANQKMSYQRRMERGEFITCTAPYGYRIVNKKDLEIVPEEASIVRQIYTLFMQGKTLNWSAKHLTEQGHPAIIDPDQWEKVQTEMAVRKSKGRHHNSLSPFSAKIVCGDCGEYYGPKVWHSTDKYRRVIWQCNGKFKGEHRCSTPHLYEEDIKRLFLQAVADLTEAREVLMETCQMLLDEYLNTESLDAESAALETEMGTD